VAWAVQVANGRARAGITGRAQCDVALGASARGGQRGGARAVEADGVSNEEAPSCRLTYRVARVRFRLGFRRGRERLVAFWAREGRGGGVGVGPRQRERGGVCHGPE
jgi:hypothetical protein